MAFSFDTNSSPANGSLCVFKIRTTLLTATWTTPKDSDGTTYSSSGTQLTGGNSGANGLANTNAWFVVRDPNSTRSFSFQRGSSNTLWRVKYSKAAGFVGGSPGATQTPSATDEQIVVGGGTDASPTFATMLGTDGTQRFNMVAGDSTVGYGWWWDAFPVGNATSGTHYGMMLDVMAAGSFPAADTDPAVVAVIANTWQDLYALSGTLTHAFLSSTAWQQIYAGTIVNFITAVTLFPAYQAGQGAGTNPFSSKDDGLPVPWVRDAVKTAPSGYKGFSGMIKWAGTFRANYDTVSTTGTGSKDKIWINGILFPWDGSSPTI
jgi:hypothetical protein